MGSLCENDISRCVFDRQDRRSAGWIDREFGITEVACQHHYHLDSENFVQGDATPDPTEKLLYRDRGELGVLERCKASSVLRILLITTLLRRSSCPRGQFFSKPVRCTSFAAISPPSTPVTKSEVHRGESGMP